MKSIKSIILALMLSVVMITPVYQAKADLVPCGKSGEDMCTICDLVVGIDGIIKWFLGITFIVAMVMLVVGGIMYIMSVGNQQMVTKAKSVITYALIGVILILTAFLIITFIMRAMSAKDDAGTGFINGLTSGGRWSFTCQ